MPAFMVPHVPNISTVLRNVGCSTFMRPLVAPSGLGDWRPKSVCLYLCYCISQYLGTFKKWEMRLSRHFTGLRRAPILLAVPARMKTKAAVKYHQMCGIQGKSALTVYTAELYITHTEY
jgi:hypothetical protein